MDILELQIKPIANGYLVEIQMNKPLVRAWYHENYFCADIDEALAKLAELATAAKQMGATNLKKVRQLDV